MVVVKRWCQKGLAVGRWAQLRCVRGSCIGRSHAADGQTPPSRQSNSDKSQHFKFRVGSGARVGLPSLPQKRLSPHLQPSVTIPSQYTYIGDARHCDQPSLRHSNPCKRELGTMLGAAVGALRAGCRSQALQQNGGALLSALVRQQGGEVAGDLTGGSCHHHDVTGR